MQEQKKELTFKLPTAEKYNQQMENWHQEGALSTIRFNGLIATTNEHNDLLVALMDEGLETLNRVLTKALENSRKGIGNDLRMSNPYWVDRYVRK